MEHGGHQGEGGVTNKFAVSAQTSRQVLARLFESSSPFEIKREGNVIAIPFRFFPMRYREVLKARRE
jgi:hypothetical protein